MYRLVFEKSALKDYQKILRSPYKKQIPILFTTLENNPFEPPYEKLSGDLLGLYSRRIDIQHRLVYRVDEEKKVVVILRMWTHYGDN